MKYLSSLLFILATACIAYHEALSTVSKHGTVDLLSTWQWHLSQYGIVIFYTAAGVVFGWRLYFESLYFDNDRMEWIYIFNWKNFGRIAGLGLGTSIVMYPFLYQWLCKMLVK